MMRSHGTGPTRGRTYAEGDLSDDGLINRTKGHVNDACLCNLDSHQMSVREGVLDVGCPTLSLLLVLQIYRDDHTDWGKEMLSGASRI